MNRLALFFTRCEKEVSELRGWNQDKLSVASNLQRLQCTGTFSFPINWKELWVGKRDIYYFFCAIRQGRHESRVLAIVTAFCTNYRFKTIFKDHPTQNNCNNPIEKLPGHVPQWEGIFCSGMATAASSAQVSDTFLQLPLPYAYPAPVQQHYQAANLIFWRRDDPEGYHD